AVSELAVGAGAPALDRAAREDGARRVRAGEDARDAGGEPHDPRGDVAIDGRAVADRAGAVVAPAHRAARRRDRARSVLAGRHPRDARAEPLDRDGHRAVRRRAVAEVTVLVDAPARQEAASIDRARVEEASFELDDAVAQALNGGGHRAARGGPVAELSGVV